MACQRLAAAQQEAVLLRFKAPVAHLQSPLCGMKRKHSRHGVGLPARIGDALPQQQHAAAFGVDRALAKPTAQAGEAAFALTELGGMQLREPPREDQAASFVR